MDGLLLFHKSQGLTSNQALQTVKRLFEVKKAGHTGTLDPLATGLLPICFGRATKMAQCFLQSDKTYEVMVELGVRTDTADQEGNVIQRREVPLLNDETIESVFQRFRGEIEQVPPMFSALKVKGKRLYKLARKGMVVERAPRKVRIEELVCVAKHGLERLELRVRCGKGTYIRTLVDDIGESLGCGAHVKTLKRTQVGCFRVEDSYSYPALKQLKECSGLEGLKRILKEEFTPCL